MKRPARQDLGSGSAAHASSELERALSLISAAESAAVRFADLDPSDVTEAIHLLQASRDVQASGGAEAAQALVRAMTAAHVDLVPPAAVEQARRAATLRRALLATPAYSHETLNEVRADASLGATRTWVSRARDRRRLFALKLEGRTIIPAFQLTDEGDVRDDLAPVLEPLLEADLSGWTIWTWLTSSSALLSGGVPVDLLDESPSRVRRAAVRFASSTRAVA